MEKVGEYYSIRFNSTLNIIVMEDSTRGKYFDYELAREAYKQIRKYRKNVGLYFTIVYRADIPEYEGFCYREDTFIATP